MAPLPPIEDMHEITFPDPPDDDGGNAFIKFFTDDVRDFIVEDVPDFFTEDIPEFFTEDVPDIAGSVVNIGGVAVDRGVDIFTSGFVKTAAPPGVGLVARAADGDLDGVAGAIKGVPDVAGKVGDVAADIGRGIGTWLLIAIAIVAFIYSRR